MKITFSKNEIQKKKKKCENCVIADENANNLL